MSCDITSGIAKGCNDNLGGVKNVYLANAQAPQFWYTYEMDKGTANLVETYDINQAASIVGYTQTLTMQLNKMAADKQQQIAKIAEANNMLVRVETNQGNVFEYGVERGAYLASGTSTTGVSYGDANQSELVIQANSKQPMTLSTVPTSILPGTVLVRAGAEVGDTMNICGFFDFEDTQVNIMATPTSTDGWNNSGTFKLNSWFANNPTPLNLLASWKTQVQYAGISPSDPGVPYGAAWSQWFPGIAQAGGIRVPTRIPAQYVTSWPATDPGVNTPFDIEITNFPFVMSPNNQTMTDFCILKNDLYCGGPGGGFNLQWETTAGTNMEITITVA